MALLLTLDARSLGTLTRRVEWEQIEEKTLLPPLSTFELDGPLASTNSVGLGKRAEDFSE